MCYSSIEDALSGIKRVSVDYQEKVFGNNRLGAAPLSKPKMNAPRDEKMAHITLIHAKRKDGFESPIVTATDLGG